MTDLDASLEDFAAMSQWFSSRDTEMKFDRHDPAEANLRRTKKP
jgi:hypothetical protein